MPISDELECIWIHIPKTGGSSIKQIMEKFGTIDLFGRINEVNVKRYKLYGVTRNSKKGNKPQVEDILHLHHLKWPYVKYVAAERWNRYFKFAFVRNPWDLVVSQYHYGLQHGPRPEFKTWLKGDTYYPTIQSDYVIDSLGKKVMDIIYSFELYKTCMEHLFDNLSIYDIEIPHAKKSEHNQYREYYDDESKQIVAKLYALDIRNFKYEF